MTLKNVKLIILLICFSTLLGCSSGSEVKKEKNTREGNLLVYASYYDNEYPYEYAIGDELIMPNYDNHYGIVVESEDNVKVIKKPLKESKICDIEIEIEYGEKIDGKQNKSVEGVGKKTLKDKKVYNSMNNKGNEEKLTDYDFYTIEEDEENYYIKYKLDIDLAVNGIYIKYKITPMFEKGQDGYYAKRSLCDNKKDSIKVDEIKFMTAIDNCEIRAEKLWTKNENVMDIYQECNDVVVEYKLDSNDQAEVITRNNIDKDTLSYKKSNLSENDLKSYYSEETKEGKLPVKGMNAENVIAEQKKKGLR